MFKLSTVRPGFHLKNNSINMKRKLEKKKKKSKSVFIIEFNLNPHWQIALQIITHFQINKYIYM